mgnify:CR=1 FL=1
MGQLLVQKEFADIVAVYDTLLPVLREDPHCGKLLSDESLETAVMAAGYLRKPSAAARLGAQLQQSNNAPGILEAIICSYCFNNR